MHVILETPRLTMRQFTEGYATEGSRALIGMGFSGLGIERVFGRRR